MNDLIEDQQFSAALELERRHGIAMRGDCDQWSALAL